MTPQYAAAKYAIIAVGSVLWRIRTYGAQNVPSSGGAIIACNHISHLDPPLLGAYCPRQIHYMAKKELFAIPLLGPMITAFGAYPVDREGSAASAIKRSVDVLRKGKCIGIFPEGGRNVHGDKEARTGVALVAALGKVPVVPAYIHNSEKAGRLAQIKVAFGPPLRLPEDRKATRDDLAKFTDDVMDAIRSLGKSLDGNS